MCKFVFIIMYIFYFCRNSASCTHVLALLHALASLTSPQFSLAPSNSDECPDEEVLPITSLPCRWKPPKKRKESTMPMSEATFAVPLNSRPMEFRGTAANHLPDLLQKLSGKNLCVSLLFDPKYQHWRASDSCPGEPHLPDEQTLRNTVDSFKASLAVTDEDIQKIERETVEQRNSSLWYKVRHFRLTASLFGTIFKRKPGTPLDKLVMRILQRKRFTSAATEWGVQQEPAAIDAYVKYKQSQGCAINVSACGIYICKSHPFLGASPDRCVYDPS